MYSGFLHKEKVKNRPDSYQYKKLALRKSSTCL